MDKRSFLKHAGFFSVSVATGGILTACGGGESASVLPSASGTGWKFPQSVASGDPRADSIMLWTRVLPLSADSVQAASGGNDVAVRLIVSAANNNALLGTNGALSGATVVDTKLDVLASYDNTIRNKVTGLLAGQTYYYQFIAGDVRSNVGRFKTAPAANADVAQLKFAFITCQDWTVNHWGAFDEIAKNEELDFILHLGDYIYETIGQSFQTGSVEARHTALHLPDGTALKDANGVATGAVYATTLNDYRYLYKSYRSDPRMQAVHERFAYICIWDDHEFSDDAWQDVQTYEHNSIAAGGGDTHQTQRRRSASQAWFEFMPADVSFDVNNPGFQNISIYRDFQFGKLAHLIMTDERLYRADHVIPESAVNPATGNPINSSMGTRYFVPQGTYDYVEAQKMAAAAATGDPLYAVSMLGQTQRDWWKGRMQASTNTWKLWGNEVSLMRMGLNGVDAVATLLALNSIQTLATNISNTVAMPALGGNLLVASALVAAVTAGATQTVATNAAIAIATADVMSADMGAAAVDEGLSAAQAGITVATYNAAKAAAPAGAATQIGAAAQTIAFGWIKPDIQANKQNSVFVAASGQQAALTPYFTKFLLNCDQWDGFNSERKALMQHLKTNNIGNVVALTGDIHAFFAGTVSDDFDTAGGGAPVMVDLVTAGISSDSFFTYMRKGAEGTGLAALVTQRMVVPVPMLGDVSIDVNLLDYTMGKAALDLATLDMDSLAEQVRVQIRGAIAAKGVPEGSLLDGMVEAVLQALKADPEFNRLLGLAQQLAGLGNNPWIKHLNSDAQGYSVVTLTPASLVCEFKQVNKLVKAGVMTAPTDVVARVTTATVTSGVVDVTIS
ncbi:MAG: alkaline phosphatase D family protein [Gammaproteobacteria bacterium]|uniref:alkaline phosphatase D family protein n=1 Tax=Rhodoferax sp. TaxID=50421 RepID=UPI001815DDCE|nr:alkaline phosphatase D family protein [Rhodoferax sp.]MBU3899638.1 alkaline phosphatase D family protein [Gammaproteobacteria bacterium]MBA3056563.1 phosphodiesterase [Rhodoferax sp.]MBU3998969.1 alkaline phosphatase D family protein [Gammaproteobacteria bacterium]MBU4018114.1 alkaline phosphatase D family protein [Gammaproteobacteria bacterium]MBU4080195.1 alkaline phosphatase D family protein [Gammaproteobacteria bacterium]